MTDTADHERPALPLGAVGWTTSAAVFVFSAWGYLTRAEAFAPDLSAGDFLRSTGAGFVLLAALGGIAQFGAAIGAQAIRRAKTFRLTSSFWLSVAMVVGGGLFTAYSVHNAFDATGMLAPGGAVAALAWFVSIGVVVFELGAQWVDESLRSEAHARRNADDEKRLRAARGERDAGGPLGVSIEQIDFRAMTDDALALVCSQGFSIAKRARDEMNARAKVSTPSKRVK